MPLKFNPFTGTFDYFGAGKEEITNANVKPAAGIEESKLSLPEVIKKLTTQTIEAEKKFETPEPAEVSTVAGSPSINPILVKSGKGGKTSSATSATGGTSGKIEMVSGEGGLATTAAKENKGGESGKFINKTGLGGSAESNTSERNVGGASGFGTYNTGNGGNGLGESSVKNTGGASGTWTGGSGNAGEAKNSTKENEGGATGAVSNTSGNAGPAVGLSSTTLNKGGKSGGWTAGTGEGGAATSGAKTTKAEGGSSGEAVLRTGTGGTATGKSEFLVVAESEVEYKSGSAIIKKVPAATITKLEAGVSKVQPGTLEEVFVGNVATYVKSPGAEEIEVSEAAKLTFASLQTKFENRFSTTTVSAGSAQPVKFKSGDGGTATVGTKVTGGNAGAIVIESGKGGTATGAIETNTQGTGGAVRIILGDGGNSTEVNSGTFKIYYGKEEAARLRLEVTEVGNVIIKKSLTVSTNIEAEGTLGCLGKLTVGKAKANSPAEMRSGLILSATENFKLETEKSKTLKPANSLSVLKLAVSVVASTTITGLEFPAEVQHEGTIVTIFNEVSSKPAKILHNNAESTEEFRFWLRGAAAEVELKEREGMMFQLLGASNNARWVQL